MVDPFGWYLKGCRKGANHFSGPTVLRTIREKGCQGCKDTVSLQGAGVQDGFRWNFSLVILYQCHLSVQTDVVIPLGCYFKVSFWPRREPPFQRCPILVGFTGKPEGHHLRVRSYLSPPQQDVFLEGLEVGRGWLSCFVSPVLRAHTEPPVAARIWLSAPRSSWM